MEDEKITKKDIKEIVGGAIEEFALIVNQGFTEQTKLINSKFNELDNKIDNVKDELNSKIDNVKDELNSKIDNVKDELNNKIDGIISSNDNIAKEIQDMRAEQAAIIGGNQRVNDTLIDYGDRITELEIHTNLKPAEAMA